MKHVDVGEFLRANREAIDELGAQFVAFYNVAMAKFLDSSFPGISAEDLRPEQRRELHDRIMEALAVNILIDFASGRYTATVVSSRPSSDNDIS